MKLTDFAFRKRYDTNACKAHQLEEGGDVFLIATDAIKRLGEHNVELAFTRVLEEFLVTRTELTRARYATVCVCCGESPFFANDPLSANKELILDRCRALEIGRIAGVYAYAHDGSPRSRPCMERPFIGASSRAGRSIAF